MLDAQCSSRRRAKYVTLRLDFRPETAVFRLIYARTFSLVPTCVNFSACLRRVEAADFLGPSALLLAGESGRRKYASSDRGSEAPSSVARWTLAGQHYRGLFAATRRPVPRSRTFVKSTTLWTLAEEDHSSVGGRVSYIPYSSSLSEVPNSELNDLARSSLLSRLFPGSDRVCPARRDIS